MISPLRSGANFGIINLLLDTGRPPRVPDTKRWPCATKCHEPCQAGNRAALSGFLCAPQQACASYRGHGDLFRVLFFILLRKGGARVYHALYRKYRPKTFGDVFGQDAITAALKNQVERGHIGHAYLFTGTRGTGKTTCAKIFARAVNCLNPQGGEPCGECEICRGLEEGGILDVVEIDAASNTGIDDIRALREEAVYTPASCRYKVYIIDEVHMLSNSAFNALLKIMEEPPAHVIFILATTEIQKVPATILSRCQRYDFGRIPQQTIQKRLEMVAEKEGIELSPAAA